MLLLFAGFIRGLSAVLLWIVCAPFKRVFSPGVFHKKISMMMPIIITMTSIIFSELCSNNEVPYSVTSVLLLVFYFNRFFLVDTVFREYSIIFGLVFKAKLSA